MYVVACEVHDSLSRCLSISFSLSSMEVAPLATCSTASIILLRMFPCCSWRKVNPRQGGGAWIGSCRNTNVNIHWMHMKIHVPTAEQCTFQEMGIFKGEKFSNLRWHPHGHLFIPLQPCMYLYQLVASPLFLTLNIDFHYKQLRINIQDVCVCVHVPVGGYIYMYTYMNMCVYMHVHVLTKVLDLCCLSMRVPTCWPSSSSDLI